MSETENKNPIQPLVTNKKKSTGWGINPLMPFLPQHIALAMMQQIPKEKPDQIKKLDIYEINLDKKLGSGYTSDVYLAFNTQTKTQVCIKVIDYLGLKNPQEKGMIKSQIQCLRQLDSPYILKCFDILESKEFCYIVTEICDKADLYKLLQIKKGFSEEQALIVMRQLGSALLEMKKKGIVHRDIKPQNILMKEGSIRLADFGFAIKHQLLSEKEPFNLGSPLYMSPEALLQNKYGYASDVFSFGITIYQLLHCRTPWQTNNQELLKQRMVSEDVNFKEGLSQQLRMLLSSCLQKDPLKRGTIQIIMDNELLKLPKKTN